MRVHRWDGSMITRKNCKNKLCLDPIGYANPDNYCRSCRLMINRTWRRAVTATTIATAILYALGKWKLGL